MKNSHTAHLLLSLKFSDAFVAMERGKQVQTRNPKQSSRLIIRNRESEVFVEEGKSNNHLQHLNVHRYVLFLAHFYAPHVLLCACSWAQQSCLNRHSYTTISHQSYEIQKLEEFTLTFTLETLFNLGKHRGHGAQVKAQAEEEGLSSCSFTASRWKHFPMWGILKSRLCQIHFL